MKSLFFKGFILLSAISLMVSCAEVDDGRLAEGSIEYQVTYPKMDPNSIMAELLPTQMILQFKNNNWHSDLSAGFGMFRMNVINNGNDHEMMQMMKLINEKYVVSYNEEEAQKSLKSFPEMSIEQTGNTKMIATYECKEAIVTLYGDTTTATFNIYYTNEIRLEEPNWFTQYAGIDGVLMEYQVDRYDLCTRFTAIEVLPKEVDDELFEVPDQYEILEEDEMTTKMQEIFNNFSE